MACLGIHPPGVDASRARRDQLCSLPVPTKGAHSVIGNITDPVQLRQALPGHEVIIHLAAVTGPGKTAPGKLFETNLMGTVHVLEAALEAGAKKLVFASSGAATGFSFQHDDIIPRYLPIDENHSRGPDLDLLLHGTSCGRLRTLGMSRRLSGWQSRITKYSMTFLPSMAMTHVL